MARFRPPPRATAWLIASLLRLLNATWRVKVIDQTGGFWPTAPDPARPPVIWVFWHSRIPFGFIIYHRFFSSHAACVLTSPSADGEILAQVARQFGLSAVRGSSNKRPIAALLELIATVKAGTDASVTPDGPRGPAGHLQPGLLTLAQKTGAPLVPIHATADRAWRFRTWDKLMLPKPFARVTYTLGPLIDVQLAATPEEFEAQRLRVQAALRAGSPDLETR